MAFSNNAAFNQAYEKFGVVDVMDAIVYSTATGEPVMMLDTLKVSSISVESETKEVRGGRGGTVLISYDFAKTANVSKWKMH